VSTARAADGSDAADAAGDAAAGPWRLLGVDCEMCATSESDKELLQLAVVDEADNLVMQVGRCEDRECVHRGNACVL
jgi:hypothetical protein